MNTAQRDGLPAGRAVIGMALMNSPQASDLGHLLQLPLPVGVAVLRFAQRAATA